MNNKTHPAPPGHPSQEGIKDRRKTKSEETNPHAQRDLLWRKNNNEETNPN